MTLAVIDYLQDCGESVPDYEDIVDYSKFLSKYGNWIENS
jgi:hypothetical protein